MPKYRGKDAPCVSNLKFADGSDVPRDPDDPSCIIIPDGEAKCYVGVGANISVATEPNADGNYEISVIDNDVMSTVVFNNDGTGLLTQSDGTEKLVLCGPLTIVADLAPGTDPNVEGSDGGNIIHIPGSTILPGSNGTAIIVTSDGEQKEVLCGPIQVIEDLPYGDDPFFLGTDQTGWILHLPQHNHKLVNNNDGTGTVTIEGVSCTFVKGPLDPLTVVTEPPGTAPFWDGSELHVPTSTVVPNDDGTATVTQADGTTKLVLCGPLNILADLPSGTPPNIEGSASGNIIHIAVDSVTESADGTMGTVVINGVSCTFLKEVPPVDHSVVESEDGTTGTVTIDGVACTFLKVVPPVDHSLVESENGAYGTVTIDGVVCDFMKWQPGLTAIITNNDDGTAQFTDPITGFTCPFPLQQMRDCDDNPRAKSEIMRLVTANELEANDAGYFLNWVDSGDGCTPAAPPWANLAWTTTRPDGAIYDWSIPAGAWILRCQPSVYRDFVSAPVQRITGADLTPLVDQEIGLIEIEVRNDDPCRVLCFDIDYRGGQPSFGGDHSIDNVWQVTYASTGGLWTGSPAVLWDTRPGGNRFGVDAGGTVNEKRAKQCLQPGESVTVSKSITFNPFQYNEDPSAFILIGNTVLLVCGSYEYCD